MAGNLYALATVSVTSAGGRSCLEFASIPQTYTDLLILYAARCNRSDLVADGVFLRFNSDLTAANYYNRRLIGSASGSPSSDGGANYGGAGLTDAVLATSNMWGNSSVYVNNYSQNGWIKTWFADGVTENNGSSAYEQLAAGNWTNTVPVTNIRFYPEVGTLWNQYTTAYLYGIKNS